MLVLLKLNGHCEEFTCQMCIFKSSKCSKIMQNGVAVVKEDSDHWV